MKEKYEKIKIIFKENIFEIKVKRCNFLKRFLGLMFISRENAEALLFEFKNPARIKIHSFFVFFPFIALMLNDNNKIIDGKKVFPFTFKVSSKKPYKKIIEIPFNKKYKNFIKNLNFY